MMNNQENTIGHTIYRFQNLVLDSMDTFPSRVYDRKVETVDSLLKTEESLFGLTSTLEEVRFMGWLQLDGGY
jgi:hypothetical protein